MSTQPQVSDNGNPFDVPLNSEIQESQQRQQASQAASSNGNPFDEPLASEVAEQKHATATQAASNNGNPFDVPSILKSQSRSTRLMLRNTVYMFRMHAFATLQLTPLKTSVQQQGRSLVVPQRARS